jgi:hypothetical protein
MFHVCHYVLCGVISCKSGRVCFGGSYCGMELALDSYLKVPGRNFETDFPS